MFRSFLARKAVRFLDVSFDRLVPFIRKTSYQGFDLYYSRGTSLIGRIQGCSIYEPDLSRCIVNLLSRSEKPLFLDVGANIGLVTLNILAEIPHTLIHAFEPSPHQYKLFKKTIHANGLENRVILHAAALSSEAGTCDFAIHNTVDASGDGFKDTGRAGPAHFITVECYTLDHWWELTGRPSVTAAKIDTEGSEFMVLQGARLLLDSCRPVVFMEIWPGNIKVYPFEVEDIISWLNQKGYGLYTLAGDPVNIFNVKNYLGLHESFVARFDAEVD